MRRTVRVAVSGVGRVGLLLAQTVLRRRAEYRDRLGVEVRVVGVCGSAAGAVLGSGLGAELVEDRTAWRTGLTGERWLDALVEAGVGGCARVGGESEDRAAADGGKGAGGAELDVLFEAGPSEYASGGPGLGYLRGALQRGMHGIAVSKGALVVDGPALCGLAASRGLQLRASAAGAAGMPLIDFLGYDLAGAGVERVEAVLTGTAAYVLDEAWRRGVSIDEALAGAQALGIAEADPSFDLDGWDTAAKLVIVAGFAFGEWLPLDEIARESVREATPDRLASWRAQGAKPALIGVIDRTGPRTTASVRLRAFERDHPYAASTGSAKGAFVSTRDLGDYAILGGASSPAATVAAALKDFEHLLRATA